MRISYHRADTDCSRSHPVPVQPIRMVRGRPAQAVVVASTASRASLGFTLIELLVVIAIVGMMAGLLIPAVQSAREAARRTECQSRLQQQGLALQAFHAARGSFPAGRDGAPPLSLASHEHSWSTHILPFLEESPLYDAYDFSRPWNDGHSDGSGNRLLTAVTLPVFLCPSTSHDWAGATDYGGSYGTMLTRLPPGFGVGYAFDSGVLVAVHALSAGTIRQSPIRIAEISDGTSRTFLVLEDAGRVAEEGGQWGNGHNCFSVDLDGPNQHRSNEIYSDHPGGAHALMADGSLRFVPNVIDPSVLGGLCTRGGGEAIAD